MCGYAACLCVWYGMVCSGESSAADAEAIADNHRNQPLISFNPDFCIYRAAAQSMLHNTVWRYEMTCIADDVFCSSVRHQNIDLMCIFSLIHPYSKYVRHRAIYTCMCSYVLSPRSPVLDKLYIIANNRWINKLQGVNSHSSFRTVPSAPLICSDAMICAHVKRCIAHPPHPWRHATGPAGLCTWFIYLHSFDRAGRLHIVAVGVAGQQAAADWRKFF